MVRIMMSRTALFVAALALAGAAGVQPLEAQTLTGTYTIVPEASDDIDRAIDQGTAGMNFIVKPIARKRLRSTNLPYQRIVIERAGGHVSTTLDARAPIRSPDDGAAVQWTREDGEVFDLTTVWSAAELRQTFRAEDGQRENVYRALPGGRMEVLVTITSGRLAAPLKYRLVYERAR